MNEEWRPVVGYEGMYEVSNTGDVKSLPRKCPHSSGTGVRRVPKRILTCTETEDGYAKVVLSKEGVHRDKLVHRLVAEAFIANPHSLPIVNHKDFNKKNNNVNNLEWCTQKDNVIHAIQGGHSNTIGKEARKRISTACKLALSKKVRCVEDGREFDSYTDCCNFYHITHSTLKKSIQHEITLKRVGLRFEGIK